MRAFISIDFPEDIKEEIKKIQRRLPEFKGKFTEEENLHLTLKFLGEIDEEKAEEIKEKLKEIKFKKFEAEIDDIGVFSEKFIRIVWLGIDKKCKDLWKLQEEIDNKLEDLFGRERRFMGHITIARIKNIKDKKKFLDELTKVKADFEFEVSNFILKESTLKEEGPEYKNIEIFNLE